LIVKLITVSLRRIMKKRKTMRSKATNYLKGCLKQLS